MNSIQLADARFFEKLMLLRLPLESWRVNIARKSCLFWFYRCFNSVFAITTGWCTTTKVPIHSSIHLQVLKKPQSYRSSVIHQNPDGPKSKKKTGEKFLRHTQMCFCHIYQVISSVEVSIKFFFSMEKTATIKWTTCCPKNGSAWKSQKMPSFSLRGDFQTCFLLKLPAVLRQSMIQ